MVEADGDGDAGRRDQRGFYLNQLWNMVTAQFR
jgi:hypothetical protein